MTLDREPLKLAIAARLDAIPEPCSFAMGAATTLAGMGLIDDIAISDDGRVTITLCLTNPGCVHFTGMQKFIGDEVGALERVTGVTVVQTLDKLWSPDRARA